MAMNRNVMGKLKKGKKSGTESLVEEVFYFSN